MASKSPADMSNLPNAFNGASLKVERAKRHISELEGIIKFLGAVDRQIFAVPRDADGRNVLAFQNWPAEAQLIPLVLGDAIHNLRSALDHVWTALDRAVTGKPSQFALFPFHETRENLIDSVHKSKVCIAFPEVKRLILDQVKSHTGPGGNHLLWSLTKLNKLDKHNLLIPTLIWHTVEFISAKTAGGAHIIIENGSFSGNAQPFFGDVPLLKYEQKGSVTIEAQFPSGTLLAGEPVIPALLNITQATSKTIDLFRSHFIR